MKLIVSMVSASLLGLSISLGADTNANQSTTPGTNAPSGAPAASRTPGAKADAPIQLEKFEVAARQEQFYNSIDRKVYNVGKDVVSTTGTASDLLQNVPSVQVDVDGNVSLRGDSGVEILINGKPSAMMGRNRAAVLEQMNAAEIERVEVITNPSAKFRPDGTAGIINLVMARPRTPGYVATVRSNIGNDERYNIAVNGSINKGKYTTYGSASLRQDSRPYFADEFRSRFDDAGNLLDSTSQQSSTEARPFTRIGRIGAEYRPNDSTKIGASVDYDDREFTRRALQRNISRDAGGAILRDYDRLRTGPETEDEFEFAFTFERNFNDAGHELSAELRLGRSREQEENRFTNIFRTPATPTAMDTTLARNSEQDTDLSIDYSRPLAAEAKLELGYEGEREKTDLDFRAENIDALTGGSVVDGGRTNRFLYDGTIHALYATYGRPFGKFGLLAGMRLEHTIVKTRQVTTGVADTTRYSRLYPSLHLNYRFTDAQQLQFSYSHRVNRPDGDDLNPFVQYDDPFNLRAGNPDLVPEDTHSIETGYHYERDGTSYLASIYFRHRRNGFTQVTRELDENTLLTTDENLGTSRSVGLELGATTRFKERVAFNFSANVYHQEIDAANLGFGQRRSTVAWDAKLNANWEATSQLRVQLTTGYSARRLTAQGERHPSSITNLGMRYTLENQRASFVVTMSDIFRTLRYRTTVDTPNLQRDIDRRRNSQVIYVGFVYHFGRAAKGDDKLEFDESL